MNFDISEDQQMMRETFARFLDDKSSIARVRAAQATGFDRDLWNGLAELGTFSMRVPESAGGMGLGTFDAVLLMEEAGRTLATGPLAESLLAARLLAQFAPNGDTGLLEPVLAGQSVATLAYHDIAEHPVQWVAGGAVADLVLARSGDALVAIHLAEADRRPEPTLSSNGIGELALGNLPKQVLASGAEAIAEFARAIEEWKLLIAAGLAGLTQEAIRLAAAYACERSAFGQPIGTYQAISHPLADLRTEADGGKLLVWRVIHDLARGDGDSSALVPLAMWWNATTAATAVTQALRTFGGYGLTTEYDIHLYNLRAKEWPLVFGDPNRLLEEAGRRLYTGEAAELPEVGDVAIDFDPGEQARALAKELDDFFNANLTPELRAKAHYSWDGHDPGIHKKLAEARLLFPAWPKEYGGREAEPYALDAMRRIWEKQGWGGHAAGTTSMVGHILRRFGSDDVKRDILAKVAAGEAICSLGYSEPGSGSDVFAAQCRATRDGDGWRIDGTKMFTSGANFSDYVLLLTRTNPDVPKHKGLTMFIVPLKQEGVSVQPVFTFQDERTNITFYDGVRVPDSYRLGEVDGGVRVMSAALEIEHGGGFGKSQQALLEAAEELCREIERDGHPLIEDRNAQARLARTHANVAVSELLATRALWASTERRPSEGFGPMAKLFSSEKFLSDARDLLDLTAPYSLSKRSGPAGFINQSYRHAHGTTIYGGTSEIHRSMIAERALGLPRSRA